MRLPFLHETGAGVYLTDTTACWVQLTRLRDQFTEVRTAEVPIVAGDVEAALQALVTDVAPPTPFVVSHLAPVHLRPLLLEGPGFDDPESRQAWLTTHVEAALPSGATADFVHRLHLLEGSEEATRALVLLARREAIEERENLFAEAGLTLISLTSAADSIAYGLAYLPAFLTGLSWVLVARPDEADLLAYAHGILTQRHTIPIPPSEARFCDEVMLPLMTQQARSASLYVVGHEAAKIAQQLREKEAPASPVHLATLVLPAQETRAPLTPSKLPAAALALQQVYPTLDVLNLLPPETVAARHEGANQAEARRTGLLVGGLVGSLLLLTLLFGWGLDWAQQHTARDLVRLADRVAAVKAAETRVAALDAKVQQARQLVHARTPLAPALAWLGATLPDSVWLQGLTMTNDPTPAFVLQGLAFEEQQVAAYLRRLESHDSAPEVRLIFTEVQPPSRRRGRGRYRRALIRYEISVALAAFPTAP